MYSVVYKIDTGEIEFISKSVMTVVPFGFAVKYITAEEYDQIKPELANYKIEEEDEGTPAVKVKKMKKVRNVAPPPRERITPSS